MLGPDQFLTSGPGEVTINETGVWKNILANEKFTPGTSGELTDLKKISPPPNTEDNVLIHAGDKFMNLSFSSERNEKFFVKNLASDHHSRANTAWVGDVYGCSFES